MNNQKQENRFRDNVAAIIVNEHGQVLVCERKDRPGLFQTVQGGLDGLEPKEAVLQELWEEIGVRAGVEAIKAELSERISYEWPPDVRARLAHTGYIGQEQRFFLVQIPADSIFNLTHHHQEFCRVFWRSPQDMLEIVDSLKKPGITAALRGFGLI